MRHWFAALLALWFASLSGAPLAAAILQPGGPKMACCKRQLKNCCCRKSHGSTPVVVAPAPCSDSCQQQPSNLTTPPAITPSQTSFQQRVIEARIVCGAVSAAGFEPFRSDLFQRPPPSLS
jgi:hypothetical protein